MLFTWASNLDRLGSNKDTQPKKSLRWSRVSLSTDHLINLLINTSKHTLSLAVLLYCCPECPVTVIWVDWATWAVWATILRNIALFIAIYQRKELRKYVVKSINIGFWSPALWQTWQLPANEEVYFHILGIFYKKTRHTGQELLLPRFPKLANQCYVNRTNNLSILGSNKEI